MEGSAANAPPPPPRCHSCLRDTSPEDMVLNGFLVPFHRACFPQNRLKGSNESLPRAPLAAVNSSSNDTAQGSTGSGGEGVGHVQGLAAHPLDQNLNQAGKDQCRSVVLMDIIPAAPTSIPAPLAAVVSTGTTANAAASAFAADNSPASRPFSADGVDMAGIGCASPETPSSPSGRESYVHLVRDSATKEADRAAHARLNQFAREAGNDVCADCSAPQPRWVSVTLGVFLCPQCSGEHRALGSHISRVRSLGLDNWTAEGVRTILEWGNMRANSQWEACLPDGFCKPGPLATPSEKRCWVRAKYLHDAFVSGAVFHPDMLLVPPPATAGPCFVGVLRVTVVAAVLPKRMKASIVLRLGRQSVATKRAPPTSMPAWGETHLLSIPSFETDLAVALRHKGRWRSRVYGKVTVNLSQLPLRELQGEERHELVLPLKAGATVTLQLSLLCME